MKENIRHEEEMKASIARQHQQKKDLFRGCYMHILLLTEVVGLHRQRQRRCHLSMTKTLPTEQCCCVGNEVLLRVMGLQ